MKVMANFDKQFTRMEDIQHKKEQVSSQTEVKLEQGISSVSDVAGEDFSMPLVSQTSTLAPNRLFLKPPKFSTGAGSTQ